MGKNAQGGNKSDEFKGYKAEGGNQQNNGINNQGDNQGDNNLPLQQQSRNPNGNAADLGTNSHLNTQADSQVMGSQVHGSRTPTKQDEKNRFTMGSGTENTPATAKDSNLSPMTQKNWQKPGAHFEIEEEGGFHLEQSKMDDEAECIQQNNYQMGQGRQYSGLMRADPEDSSKMIPHGKGTMTMEDGSVIEGLWKNSHAVEGIKIYSNGDRYQGQFSNDKPNGYGILKQTDGVCFEGKWLNGSIVNGTEVNQEGEIYTGQFHNRKRHGFGEHFVNGSPIKQGRWELGQLIEESGDLKGQKQFEGSNFIGQSDLDGKNARLRFANNQELTEEEILQRQKQMNEFVSQNANAVEQALDAHEKAIDDLQASFEPPKLLYDNDMNVLDDLDKVDENQLEQHALNYKASHARQRQEYDNDRWSIDVLQKELNETPIYCTKYNYTLDKVLMNHLQFDCKLEVSKDGKTLILHNRKMTTVPRYDYEQTPDDIIQEEKARKVAKDKGEKFELEEKAEEFSYHQSSSTCSLSDIEGMIVGGHSSRFWIYRKHMISLDYDIMKFDNQAPGVKTSFPFFSWQCLTLIFSTRTVDLVIKKDRDMDLLVRFLVQALNTIDGRKGSANFYIEASIINEIERREKRLNRRTNRIRNRILEAGPLASDEEFDETLQIQRLSEEEKQQIRYEKTKEIHRQTMFKYTLMRVRAKIGYHAFQRRMTINEHIMTQILRSYNELTRSNQIPRIAEYSTDYIRQFENILVAPAAQTLPLLMELAQNQVYLDRKEQIFKQKTLMKFDVRYEHELTLEQREQYEEIIEKNVGKEVKEKMNEKMRSHSQRLSDLGLQPKIVDQDDLKNMSKINQFSNGFGLFDKSKCLDIYKTVQVDGLNMYELRSKRVMIKYKLDKKVVEQQLTKVRFMLGVADLIDIFYIKAVLQKKALLKKQFVLDVEHNLECFIPHELSPDLYPYSYRYYDPIIQITNQLFSTKQKLYHCLKTDFYLKKIKGKDFKKKFLEDFGMLTTEKNRKQTFKHALLEQHEEQDIKHSQSKHHISLQKSRYLMVESTEEGLQKLADLQTYVIEKKWERGPHERIKNLEDLPLELRFCHQAVVNMKRNKFIIFKQSQFARLDHLKNQGQKFNTMRLLERQIRHNFDFYYANRPRDVNYNPNALEKDLDLVPYDQLTDRQKCILDADKLVYFDWLLSQGERTVMTRRNRIRVKTVDQTYSECDKVIPYEIRNNWIELQIEQRFKYFDQVNDLQQSGSEMEVVRRKIQQVTAKLKAKAELAAKQQLKKASTKNLQKEDTGPFEHAKQTSSSQQVQEQQILSQEMQMEQMAG